jgi:transposase-like protein
MEDKGCVSYVIAPDGEKMTRADLPPPEVRRWVPRRKARVVAAVEGGLITREEACERYALSDEELESWTSRLTQHGLKGLCVTRINARRGTSE